MEFDILTFDKTLEQRQSEYKEILGTHKVLPASEVRGEWSYVAELVLEPIGWRALWKIPAEKCEELGILFPTVLLILVEGIDSKSLTAEVSVLNHLDEKNIPKNITVYLIDLYATVQQVNETIFVKETADFIDKLRFFYNHLWMPWDVDDDNQDWTEAHLDSRLKLFYDMQAGSVSSEMVLHIQYLIQEGQRIHSKILLLEEKVENEVNVETVMCELMDLHFCKDQIKHKFEMYEDPFKRSLLVWKQHRKSCEKSESSENQKSVYIISDGRSVETYIDLLKEAKAFINKDEFVKSSFRLQETLNQACKGDSLLLANGQYGLLGLGGLETGGSIRGISSPENVILKPQDAGNILLDCSGGVVTLENLTIDIQKMQVAILVHDATLHLRNCHLIGQNSKTNTGLLVLGKGCVVAQDCKFSGFGSAVIIYSKGEASLTSCNIQACYVGVKVQDDAKLNLMKCRISECEEFGIKAEIHKGVTCYNNEVGSVTLLNSVGEVQLSDTNVTKNAKGDVCIIQKNNSLPSGDLENPAFSFLLFSNPPTLQPSLLDHGDE